MVMHTLPADVIKNPLIRLVPLKSARAAGEGRLIALAPASARALAIYLRVRRHHALADSDWVWLGTRNRGRLQTTGLRLMLIRRAEQAGYQGVTPHQFRHTFSDDWQIGRIAFGATFPRSAIAMPQGMPVGLIAGTPAPSIANPQVRVGAWTAVASRASMLHLILLR